MSREKDNGCLVLTEVDTTRQQTMGFSSEFRERQRYSEVLKRQVAFEVMSGALTKSEACRTYGILSVRSVNRMIDRFGAGILSEHKELLAQMGRPKKERPTPMGGQSDAEQLRREVERLKKDLRAAELKAEAYSLMIDLAEKELKVAIRKKSGTK